VDGDQGDGSDHQIEHHGVEGKHQPMSTRMPTIAVIMRVFIGFDLLCSSGSSPLQGSALRPEEAVLVPYTLLVMLSSYSAMRKLVMPMSFVLVTFFAIYLVVRNGTISYQKASGLLVFSGIVIFCFYSFILLKERLPVEKFGYDAVFFILLILCFAWGGDTCAYFAGRAFGKHKLCPVVSPKKTVEGAIGGVLGTMVFGVVAAIIYSMTANRMEAFTRSNIGVSMYVIIALLGLHRCSAGHLRRPVCQCGQASVRHQGLRHHLPGSRRYSGPLR